MFSSPGHPLNTRNTGTLATWRPLADGAHDCCKQAFTRFDRWSLSVMAI
jgi:hypothetical protein